MCRTHHSGLHALGAIHITFGLLICIAQATITAYLEIRNSFDGRYMNISPGLWLGVSLLVTGAISVHFSRKLSKSQVLPRLLVAACVISIGLAIVVIYFDQKFLLDYKVWLWRKQRMTTDPNHYEVDTKYQQFYVVRNKLDIEALFILGACLMGLTVVEIVLLVISISTASRFLCACCSETAFVSTNNTFKARTSIIMVPSRDNLLLSLPLLTTEL